MRQTRTRRTTALLGIMAVAFALVFASATGALAVKRGKLTTTVTPAGERMTATYSFSQYRCDNNDVCTGYRLTFPAGTDVTGTTSPDGTVTVAGQTVTVTYATPISGNNAALPVRLSNVVNPAAGTYNVGNITFLMSSNPAQETQATADYTILVAPYLALSIETPSNTQTVDFGQVDPGVTSAAQTVIVTVDGSSPTTLTWSATGDALLMGLAVSGAATRMQPAGVTVYFDDYTVTPSFAATPLVPLSAIVLYTVVM